jgi:sortase B
VKNKNAGGTKVNSGNKDTNKAVKRKRRTAAMWLLLILSLSVMALSGYKLLETEREYRTGDESYANLTDKVRPGGKPVLNTPPGTAAGPAGTSSPAPAPEQVSQWGAQPVAVPEAAIDFDGLQETSPSAAAWLYCPDTPIDYPVMAAADYDYWLHRLPDGTRNANGSLFLDYNHKADFTDKLSVIYGHNMKSGKMFGTLTKYKQQSYHGAHPHMYLYTAEGEAYRIDLVYGCVIGAGQWRERAFMFEENLDALLGYARENTTFESSADYTDEDRFVVLSTCSYEFDGARYVVVGVLRPGQAQ